MLGPVINAFPPILCSARSTNLSKRPLHVNFIFRFNYSWQNSIDVFYSHFITWKEKSSLFQLYKILVQKVKVPILFLLFKVQLSPNNLRWNISISPIEESDHSSQVMGGGGRLFAPYGQKCMLMLLEQIK